MWSVCWRRGPTEASGSAPSGQRSAHQDTNARTAARRVFHVAARSTTPPFGEHLGYGCGGERCEGLVGTDSLHSGSSAAR